MQPSLHLSAEYCMAKNWHSLEVCYYIGWGSWNVQNNVSFQFHSSQLLIGQPYRLHEFVPWAGCGFTKPSTHLTAEDCVNYMLMFQGTDEFSESLSKPENVLGLPRPSPHLQEMITIRTKPSIREGARSDLPRRSFFLFPTHSTLLYSMPPHRL